MQSPPIQGVIAMKNRNILGFNTGTSGFLFALTVPFLPIILPIAAIRTIKNKIQGKPND